MRTAPGHQAHYFSSSAKQNKHTKPKSTYAHYAIHICAKRTSTNKATYLSLKSDLQRELGTFLEKLCKVLERERSKFWRVLRDFAV